MSEATVTDHPMRKCVYVDGKRVGESEICDGQWVLFSSDDDTPMTASELRAIAKKLDELNGVEEQT